MPATIPATIPEDKPLSFNDNEKKEEGRTVFKLIKVYTDDDADDSTHAYDTSNKTILNKSHTQLFYNITDKQDYSQCKPSYCREVRRPKDNIDNLYWYSEALKSVSSPTSEPVTLWTIDQVKIKKSKVFKKFKRPRTFSINSTELGSNSTFEYGSSENEPKGYSGEISAPFDDTCTQRYRWVRYKDGSRWSFIARNDPNTSLAELRKTDSENAFDIVFMKSPPPGWRVGDTVNRYSSQSTSTEFNARYGRIFSDNAAESVEFIGRYPSVFSNPSTYRSSTTSGFLSNRESSFSDISNSPTFDGRISTLSNLKNISGNGNGNGKDDESYDKEKFSFAFSEDNFTSPKIDSERYWQEYVLASTVAVQEEVNSNKRRLWKKGN